MFEEEEVDVDKVEVFVCGRLDEGDTVELGVGVAVIGCSDRAYSSAVGVAMFVVLMIESCEAPEDDEEDEEDSEEAEVADVSLDILLLKLILSGGGMRGDGVALPAADEFEEAEVNDEARRGGESPLDLASNASSDDALSCVSSSKTDEAKDSLLSPLLSSSPAGSEKSELHADDERAETEVDDDDEEDDAVEPPESTRLNVDGKESGGMTDSMIDWLLMLLIRNCDAMDAGWQREARVREWGKLNSEDEEQSWLLMVVVMNRPSKIDHPCILVDVC